MSDTLTTAASPKLTTIHLVGSLGRAIGHHKLELDVMSVSEAVRAIDIITNGKLGAYLSGPARDKLYKVAIQKRENVVGREEMQQRSGRGDIFIMPTIRGRNSGTGKMIAGIALIALALVSQQYQLMPYAWGMVGGTAWATAGTIAVGFGVSLLVGGITQLLTPKPQGPGETPEQAQSTSFGGNTTAVVQGGCVPVVYGRALMPAIPISITVSNNELSLSSAGRLGGVTKTTLKGGAVQYHPIERPDPNLP